MYSQVFHSVVYIDTNSTQKIKGASRIKTVIMNKNYTILNNTVMKKLKSLLEVGFFQNSYSK